VNIALEQEHELVFIKEENLNAVTVMELVRLRTSMTKTIISLSLDDEVIEAIDKKKGMGGTRSGFVNMWLKESFKK